MMRIHRHNEDDFAQLLKDQAGVDMDADHEGDGHWLGLAIPVAVLIAAGIATYLIWRYA